MRIQIERNWKHNPITDEHYIYFGDINAIVFQVKNTNIYNWAVYSENRMIDGITYDFNSAIEKAEKNLREML